jgi:tRNA (pseudouridine54-N1)-methyltransferase
LGVEVKGYYSFGRKKDVFVILLEMTMRTFIVVGHKATTTPDFSLEDLPGTSGRLDILCRCINSAFVLSHGIRRDVQVFLVLLGGEAPKTLHLKGDQLKHLNPDERTTAALLKKALTIAAEPDWSRSTPGIYVRSGSLAELLLDFQDAKLFYLREDGADAHTCECLTEDAVFILGDHLGMTDEEEALIEEAGAERISVGPLSLHADHCIVLINWTLDTRMIGDRT